MAEQYNADIYNDIVIVCIGTDRATGDTLAPIVGYKLKKKKCIKYVKLFGTLSSPIHAKNLDETMDRIYNGYKNPFIIAIDACLGEVNHVGYITVGEGSINPGSGVGRDLQAVGDMYINGIVNFSGFMDMLILQNTRLDIVMKMADTIANGIHRSRELISSLQKRDSVQEEKIKLVAVVN